jgi:hypothetical protein
METTMATTPNASEKCKSCGSCGMPLASPEDYALGDVTQTYCCYCTDKRGSLLPYDDILAMNVKYYVESQAVTPTAARQMAVEMLSAQPAWKGRTP